MELAQRVKNRFKSLTELLDLAEIRGEDQPMIESRFHEQDVVLSDFLYMDKDTLMHKLGFKELQANRILRVMDDLRYNEKM